MASYGGGTLIRFSYGASPFYLNLTRTHFGLYEMTDQRYHIQRSLDVIGCPEARRRYAYVVAQESALAKNKSVDDAADRAAYRQGIAHLEGLLNEKAGFDFAKRRMLVEAPELCFNRALYLYSEDWGAVAKCSWLQ